jgi:hypothetical protein
LLPLDAVAPLTASAISQERNLMSQPLLIIDGDSFAHRSYHGLPKSIRRRGNKGAGAIVGFANFLLRLYESELPRAVLIGWEYARCADLSTSGLCPLSERAHIRF